MDKFKRGNSKLQGKDDTGCYGVHVRLAEEVRAVTSLFGLAIIKRLVCGWADIAHPSKSSEPTICMGKCFDNKGLGYVVKTEKKAQVVVAGEIHLELL